MLALRTEHGPIRPFLWPLALAALWIGVQAAQSVRNLVNLTIGESGFSQRFVVNCGSYVRRVDLVIVPVEQWGFAVMGWTGSRQWNRSVRDYARRVRGISLTSHAAVRNISSAISPAPALPN